MSNIPKSQIRQMQVDAARKAVVNPNISDQTRAKLARALELELHEGLERYRAERRTATE